MAGLGDIVISSQVNFEDILVKAEATPPAGFTWKFSKEVWALFPGNVGTRVASVAVPSDPNLGDSRSADFISSDLEGDSDDSASEFERNLRELLPGFQGSSVVGKLDPPKISRRSER